MLIVFRGLDRPVRVRGSLHDDRVLGDVAPPQRPEFPRSKPGVGEQGDDQRITGARLRRAWRWKLIPPATYLDAASGPLVARDGNDLPGRRIDQGPPDVLDHARR
jgi:hypothetical protein